MRADLDNAMDHSTLSAYESDAARYCEEWLGQPEPADLHALWRRFLAPGRPSADIGCGCGRDVDWLNRGGFPCVGYEPCAALRARACARFPEWRFESAALPALEGLADGAFGNVVCETVLMHLPRPAAEPAVRALARVLAPGGTLYLSWRLADGPADARDRAGRLYSALPAADVRAALGALALLYDAEEISASSGRRVHRLIARRAA